MRMRYNEPAKTMGPRAAQLITELNEQRRATFTLSNVRAITGLAPDTARSLVRKIEQHGLVTRLKPGLYNLVPFEMGRARHHVGDPYQIAGEIAGKSPHYLSHGTAFELHRMLTQPSIAVYVSCVRGIRPQNVGGYDYRFIKVQKKHLFGTTQHWISKDRSIRISDLERTIIDGLRQPAYVGGVTEVAKGLWMKRDKITVARLVDYALRLDVGAVIRRLGYLLELYQLADAQALLALRAKLSATYQRLDPILPPKGPFLASWRLQLNILAAELDGVRYS